LSDWSLDFGLWTLRIEARKAGSTVTRFKFATEIEDLRQKAKDLVIHIRNTVVPL